MPEIKLVELKSIGDFLALTSLRLKREQRAFTRPVLITYLQSRHPPSPPIASKRTSS